MHLAGSLKIICQFGLFTTEIIRTSLNLMPFCCYQESAVFFFFLITLAPRNSGKYHLFCLQGKEMITVSLPYILESSFALQKQRIFWHFDKLFSFSWKEKESKRSIGSVKCMSFSELGFLSSVTAGREWVQTQGFKCTFGHGCAIQRSSPWN